MIRKVALRRTDLLVASIIFLLLNLLFSRFQPQITYNNGLEWDGVYYAKITQDFANGLRPQTDLPAVNRIGVPFLASLLDGDVVTSWRFLNFIANIFIFILLYAFLSLHFRQQWLRLILILAFLLPFHSLVRRVWWAPVSTDHWDKVFLIAGLIIMDRLKAHGWRVSSTIILSIVTFIGVFFREVVIVLPFAALFVHNPVNFDSERLRAHSITLPPALSVAPILSGILGLLLVKTIVIVAPSQNPVFLRYMVDWLWNKSLPDYVLAWFIAFGPILILPIYDWKNSIRYLIDHQYLLVYLVAVSVLGWTGGSATYRYLLWAQPVVFVLVGLAVLRNIPSFRQNWPFVLLLCITYMISQRVFWTLPDFPGGESSPLVFLTPLTSNPAVPDIIGLGSRRVNALSLASYLLLSAVLILILHPPLLKLRTQQSVE
jgi:hypothetical protein